MADALLCPGKMVIRGESLPVSTLSFQSSQLADENGRIYTKLSAERVQELAEDRREVGGRVDVHSITAEEVLEQTNKVFAPYKVKFAAPLSWFAVWKSRSFLLVPPSTRPLKDQHSPTDVPKSPSESHVPSHLQISEST